MKKYTAEYIVFLYFIVLLICSWVFYKEFALTLDGPVIILELLNGQLHSFGQHRWGSWATQFLSQRAVSNGSSLDLVIRLFSMSSFLIPFILYLISRFILKDRDLSILLAISPVLGMSDVFLHRQWPLLIGITYTTFFAVLMAFSFRVVGLTAKILVYLAGILMIYIIINTHFSLVICLLFILFFNLFYQQPHNRRAVYFWILAFVLVVVFKLTSYKQSHYEAYRFLSIIYYLIHLGEFLVNPKNYYFFIGVMKLKYLIPFMFGIAAIYNLRKNKQKWAYRFFLISIFGGLLIYNGLLCNIPYSEETLYYFEGSYLPFIFIISYPFFLILPSIEKNKFFPAILVVMISLVYLIPNLIVGIPQKQNLNTKLESYCDDLRQFPERLFIADFDAEEFGEVCYYFFNEKTLLLTSFTNPDSALGVFFTNDKKNHGSDTIPKYIIQADIWDLDLDAEDHYTYIRDYFPFFFFNSVRSDYVNLKNQNVRVLP